MLILNNLKEYLKNKATIKNSEELVAEIKEKIKKIAELEGTVAILQNVVNRLKPSKEKIDNNEQYSRRLCLIINEISLPEDGNESDSLDKVKQLISELPDIDIPEVVIDCVHRIGKFKTDENGKMIGKQMIVRFTTWRH